MTPFSNGRITLKECQRLDFLIRVLHTCQQEREISEDQGQSGGLCETGTGLIGLLLDGKRICLTWKVKILQYIITELSIHIPI